MRLNFFKYHIQNREYTTSEVMSLINNDSYKHHILSNDQHFYSAGTTAETLETPIKVAVGAIVVAALVIGAASNNTSSYNSSGGYYGNNSSNYVINAPTYNTTNNYSKSPYNNAVEIIDYGTFTGREVTKFMNEYYNYHIYKFNKNAHYSNIVNDFLNHKYIDADDIPTIGDSGLLDIAVLDSYK